MNKKQAENIARLIEQIAAGKATISHHKVWGDASKAAHDAKLTEQWVQELIEALTPLPK